MTFKPQKNFKFLMIHETVEQISYVQELAFYFKVFGNTYDLMLPKKNTKF